MDLNRVRRPAVDREARLGLGLAGVATAVGVTSFVLGCTGAAGWGILGMFLAMGLVIASLGLYTHATPPVRSMPD